MQWFETASPDRYKLLEPFAKENRANMTLSERNLWEALKDLKPEYRFRRQHVIGDFIVDFVCLKQHLVIEVDGGYHCEPRQQYDDELRTESLNKMGFKVIRFSNEDVDFETQKVIQTIKETLKRKSTLQQ